MNDAREAIARGEGALAEERTARAATTALLLEVHKAYTLRYGERDAHIREREDGHRWKAREGA